MYNVTVTYKVVLSQIQDYLFDTLYLLLLIISTVCPSLSFFNRRFFFKLSANCCCFIINSETLFIIIFVGKAASIYLTLFSDYGLNIYQIRFNYYVFMEIFKINTSVNKVKPNLLKSLLQTLLRRYFSNNIISKNRLRL